MLVEDQTETVVFLRSELERSDAGSPVNSVETHISIVLLSRTLAWKLKKAVHLPYLDFRAADRRLSLCERELALNLRTAPELYRAVRRVVRDACDRLSLDGEGTLVDAILEMNRFDEDGLLDRMAIHGGLSPRIIAQLAKVIADFHAATAPALTPAKSGSQRIDRVLRINKEGLAAARKLFGDEPVQVLIDATRTLWECHRSLLDERQRAGCVRLCHGDLHLRNIVEIDGRPILFDCLEFDTDMATIDVLYDLAFVLMDLWHRGLHGLANLLLNRYLDEVDETSGLPLMPLFLAMRATVRAHVLATRALESGEADCPTVAAESRAYLDLAHDLLEPRDVQLIAIGGFSGSGKSTAAASIAAGIGMPPGARILSSDRIRKRLHGVAPEIRLPPEAYRPDASAHVYALLREQAAAVLASGHSAIVDAVFDRQTDREQIEAVVRTLNAEFCGVWLQAPESILMDRITKRPGDPSDATADVVRAQLKGNIGALAWHRFETGDDQTMEKLHQVVRSTRNADQHRSRP